MDDPLTTSIWHLHVLLALGSRRKRRWERILSLDIRFCSLKRGFISEMPFSSSHISRCPVNIYSVLSRLFIKGTAVRQGLQSSPSLSTKFMYDWPANYKLKRRTVLSSESRCEDVVGRFASGARGGSCSTVPLNWKESTALNSSSIALYSSGGQAVKQVAVCPAVAKFLKMDPSLSTNVFQSLGWLEVIGDFVSDSNTDLTDLIPLWI